MDDHLAVVLIGVNVDVPERTCNGSRDYGHVVVVHPRLPAPEARFNALFDAHRLALLGYALRRVSDPQDAADVVADTFLVAWRRIDDVPGGDQARPWLFGVARRVLANLHRGEGRRNALARRLATELGTLPVRPQESVSPTVIQALGFLNDTDAELLRLFAWEELTPSQIATVLGVRAGTVRVRLHRARQRFAAALARLEAEDAEEWSRSRVKRSGAGGHVINEPHDPVPATRNNHEA